MREGGDRWRDALTLRSLIVGGLLAFVVGSTGIYLGHVQDSTGFGCGFYSAPMATFALFLVVGFLNVAAGALNRSWAFQRGELLIVYIMMTLANSSHCIAHFWMTVLIGPFYYATPENDWARLIHPYFPDWISLHRLEPIRLFFEGWHRTGEVPWGIWLVPLVSWLPLVLAVHLSTLSLSVILRRQWMERERLVYPLVQVPLSMVQDDERGSLIKPFFRSGVMWIGFAAPAALGLIQALHNYYTFMPTIVLSTSFSLFRGVVTVPLTLSFATLGFFFLINREVAFGLWVFSLLSVLQRGLYGILGIGWETEPALSVWSGETFPSLVHQSMGAMIALVLGGLWVGREHLKDVFRKAFFGAAEVDDSDEILSYRTAVFGLLGGVGVIGLWMWFAGLPLIAILLLLFLVFVVFVALTRVVVEGGVAVLYLPLEVTDAVVSGLGSATLGASGMVGMVFARIWASNPWTGFIMPYCAQGLKLSEQITGQRRWLFWGMLLAALIGAAGGIWMMLKMAYTHGALNLSRIHFIWLAQYVYEYAAGLISFPTGPHWGGWFHTGVGAAVMAALMAAQRYWAWWPLHPLGYPISSTFSWMMVSAFLAWAIKGIVLSYGGVRLYLAVRPFFLGLILGQFVVYGFFWIFDFLVGMSGNWLTLFGQ